MLMAEEEEYETSQIIDAQYLSVNKSFDELLNHINKYKTVKKMLVATFQIS
jgi:hypothetical protein